MAHGPPARGGRAWAGLWLFLLGVLVGALATYLGCRESVRRAGDAPAELQSGGTADGGSRVTPGRRGRRGSGGLRRNASGRSDSPAAGSRQDVVGEGKGEIAAGGEEPGSGGGEQETAAARTAPGPARAREGPARVALVIDDLGRSLSELDSLQRLGVPITYAVLPFESQTAEVVAALSRRHEEILCHLPMEPSRGGNPGPGALRAGMSQEQLRQSTLAAIAAVPGAVGVNNHMGSGLSTDPASMAAILGVLASRGLFFLDSRTSAQSVAYRVAAALGVPAAERQVFLDDDLHPEAIAAQFQRLLDLARTRGEAIAIGHPHSETLATLAAEVPRAQAAGFRFVQVSALLDHPPAAPPAPTGR
jgi:polysaccharide deacetylase 2 family uncharacterized protein YibQ